MPCITRYFIEIVENVSAEIEYESPSTYFEGLEISIHEDIYGLTKKQEFVEKSESMIQSWINSFRKVRSCFTF